MTDAFVPAKLVGVRVTAFVMVMGGLLVASVMMPTVRAAGQSARHPELAFLFAYLALWGIFLGIGLERRSSWAWEGSVYMAGLWAFGFLVIPLIVLSAPNAKLPTAVGSSIISIILAIPAFLLLRYLLRPSVRSAFGAEPVSGRAAPDAWIRLIAISTLIGSGMGLMELFSAKPQLLFGVTDNRMALFTYEVLALLVAIYSGLGLYRLNDLARRVAIAFFILCQVQYLMWLFLTPVSSDRFTPFKVCISVFCTALVALEIWYLHARRECFSRE